MPSPVGAASHIPSATTCETCHLASMPSAFVPANATLSPPGTLFLSPAPNTTMIHAGISSGCTNCHEANDLWIDSGQYPIAPTTVVSGAQYTGFQTRPTGTGGIYAVLDAAHPATGDCVTCHGTNFNYFDAQAEPPNHIPTLSGAACSTCHTTAGNYAVYTSNLTTLHGQVASTCSTCHADGKGPFAGAPGFAIVQMSTRGRHIPITDAGVAVECSGCHKTVTTFTGTIMSHMAIGDTGTSNTGNACDACHESGFQNEFFGITINFTRPGAGHHLCGAPGTPTAPNTTVCATNGGSDCITGCHQHNNIPATYKAKPPAPRAVTPTTGTAATTAKAPAAGSGTAATATTPGITPIMKFDHSSVRARCATCHDGLKATGKPTTHVAASVDCDTCHTTSAWRPAAFDHRSTIAGGCASCHNAVQAVGKPANHVATTLSCDSCHYVLAWSPVKPTKPRAPALKSPLRPTPSRPGTIPLAPQP